MQNGDDDVGACEEMVGWKGWKNCYAILQTNIWDVWRGFASDEVVFAIVLYQRWELFTYQFTDVLRLKTVWVLMRCVDAQGSGWKGLERWYGLLEKIEKTGKEDCRLIFLTHSEGMKHGRHVLLDLVRSVNLETWCEGEVGLRVDWYTIGFPFNHVNYKSTVKIDTWRHPKHIGRSDLPTRKGLYVLERKKIFGDWRVIWNISRDMGSQFDLKSH
jgi:hypothetical protein